MGTVLTCDILVPLNLVQIINHMWILSFLLYPNLSEYTYYLRTIPTHYTFSSFFKKRLSSVLCVCLHSICPICTMCLFTFHLSHLYYVSVYIPSVPSVLCICLHSICPICTMCLFTFHLSHLYYVCLHSSYSICTIYLNTFIHYVCAKYPFYSIFIILY